MWYQPTPYGMVFIPLGSFIMGQSDQDVPYNQIQTNKVVSLQAFYMDELKLQIMNIDNLFIGLEIL